MYVKRLKKNRYMFGLGTIGRDMVYSLVALQLMFYLTDVVKISKSTLVHVTGIIVAMRIFDALNDPFMGVVVDNTRSKWGKFKPWIVIGVLSSGVCTFILFYGNDLPQSTFLIKFAIVYLLWGISYTINDISYWSMLPALSKEQKEREKIGAFARICANIGGFALIVGVVPITGALAKKTASLSLAYTIFTLIVVLIMIFFQFFTVFGVKEDYDYENAVTTSLKELWKVIVKNDQLMWTTIFLLLFQVGYSTTISFGLYYFKYIYGDEGMFSVFAAVLGISQLLALSLYPIFSKYFNRKKLYFIASILVFIGYIGFYFSPVYTIVFIAISGVFLFFGEALIQLLMLMFISDTVEYGEYKLHRRNDSITLSLQPFISKMAGAIASGIVGFTLVISGIKEAVGKAQVTVAGAHIFKASMMLLPMLLIFFSYLLYRKKYTIDESKYKEILSELERRKKV